VSSPTLMVQPTPALPLATIVACGLARPFVFGVASSAKLCAFQSLNALANVTLLESRSNLAGLLAFHSAPDLAIVNELSPWLTAISEASVAGMSQRFLSRRSIGRFSTRSALYFFTRNTCGASGVLT